MLLYRDRGFTFSSLTITVGRFDRCIVRRVAQWRMDTGLTYTDLDMLHDDEILQNG